MTHASDGDMVDVELYDSALAKIAELLHLLKIEVSSRDYWRMCNESNAALRVRAEDALREIQDGLVKPPNPTDAA